jgi:cullin-associated NEDD8-dissociated protein 1
LKSENSFGKIREPLLKVIHFMRSLEIVSQNSREIDLNRLHEFFGQELFSSPTVFNFYRSKFQPNSAVKRSELYSPEAQLLTLPRITSFLNSMYSFIEYGLTDCFDGFGLKFRSYTCDSLKTRSSTKELNSGYLTYSSSILDNLNPLETVNYFSLLLTGGRLDQSQKNLLLDSFNNYTLISKIDGVKVLLELLVSTPEFQITSMAKAKRIERISSSSSNFNQTKSNDYRAIIYVYLDGGMDSYNLLVPYDACIANTDLFKHYQEIRTTASLNKNDFLPIDVPSWSSSQPCKKFGVLSKMQFLYDSYNLGEAAFIANIGALVEPLTASEFSTSMKKKPLALFAHDMQSQHAQTLHADSASSSGILGRIRDQLSLKNRKTYGFSVSASYSNTLEDTPGISDSQIIINPQTGVELLDKHKITRLDMHNAVLNMTSGVCKSIFADTWNEIVNIGYKRASSIQQILNNAVLKSDLRASSNWASYQMDVIAKAILSRSKTESAADFFDFRMGEFDTHGSFTRFGELMTLLDSTLRAFVTEMKSQNIWDKVTIVVASEFARTLRSNGKGTDRGWGGNTFIMGGSVKGGQILGKYPSKLDDPAIHIGNGILIPTMPWEGLWNGIAQWAGVPDEALDDVLPNRNNFINERVLLNKETLFK